MYYIYVIYVYVCIMRMCSLSSTYIHIYVIYLIERTSNLNHTKYDATQLFQGQLASGARICGLS